MRRMQGVLVMLLLIQLSSAQQDITVEKILQSDDVVAGGSAMLALNISNPFDQPVSVQITDKNVLGGNGLDIQCYELSIPPGGGLLKYEPITPFAEGEYTLEAAEVSYTHPETSEEQTATSNQLTVAVGKGTSAATATRQGITTIYRCGNVNMQSTSYQSSGGSSSFSVNIGGSSISQRMEHLRQQMQPQTMQERLQDMQQGTRQDTRALKQQMEDQMAEKRQQEQALKQEIENNPEFQRMHQQLTQQGFQPKTADIHPFSNDTGDFQYNYEKNGETASIEGTMEKGEIQDITQWGSYQQRQLEEALHRDPRFQQLQQKLIQEGFHPRDASLSPPQNNRSQFTVTYNNSLNHTANITGTIHVNATVEDIEMQREGGEERILWWLILPALLLAAIVYRLTTRKNGTITAESPTPRTTVDHPAEAVRMLDEAQRLFDTGKKKEAYARVSEAVRYYFRHDLGHAGDVTDYELVRHLDTHHHPATDDVRACLDRCRLVKFARYHPNHEDFQHAIARARKALEGKRI